jgi:transposase
LGRARRGDPSQAQWEVLAEVLPPVKATGRRPWDSRQVINGIRWRVRTGSPWRDLPERYGPWGTVYGCSATGSATGSEPRSSPRCRPARTPAARNVGRDRPGPHRAPARCSATSSDRHTLGSAATSNTSVDRSALYVPACLAALPQRSRVGKRYAELRRGVDRIGGGLRALLGPS